MSQHLVCLVQLHHCITLGTSIVYHANFLVLGQTVSLSLCFSGHFPGRWTRFSRCLLKQRMMEAVVISGTTSHAKLQSNHHHQQTNTQFFTGRMPFLSPNQQCQSTEVRRYKRKNGNSGPCRFGGGTWLILETRPSLTRVIVPNVA